MPSSSNTSIIGWILSFILYFSILFVGVTMLQQHMQKVQKYTASKKNLLTVTLVERKKAPPKKKKIVKKKKETIKREKTPSKTEPKTVRTQKTVSQKKSLKNLFDNIDIPKTEPKKQQQKKSRKKVVQKKIEEVEEVKKSFKNNRGFRVSRTRKPYNYSKRWDL